MRVYDFGSGRTDPGSFPTEELAAAAQQAVREIGSELCSYPGDMGQQNLREIMAARESEREGDDVSPEGELVRLAVHRGLDEKADELDMSDSAVDVDPTYLQKILEEQNAKPSICVPV